MSFAEIASNKVPVIGCTIGSIVAGLPDEEAAALKAMLDSDIETWPHTGADSIQSSLKAEGYEVGDKTVRAHRAGACRCTRGDR